MTISQYANSPRFEKLRSGLVDVFDDRKSIQDWFNIVFNIKTATGFGLDIWGKILNQGRAFTYTDPNSGVSENIYLEGEQTIDGVHYTAEEVENTYRQVLFLKAMSNITNATLRSLNDLLLFYYEERGRAYAIEYGTMEIRFVFEFYVNKLEKSIFNSPIMPKPTGVLLSFEYVPMQEYFGFFVDGLSASDQPYTGFDQKTFYR